MATYTTLRIGSRGNDVKKLQQALGITDDGIYGSQTAAAVRAYQKKNGLLVDGIAGNQTLGKLYGNSNTNKTNTAPKTTSAKKQTELDKLGTFKYNAYTEPDSVIDARNKLDALQKPGEFQYGNQQALDDILNKIMNGEEFSYDVNGDALYQQYKDLFVNQGKLAMEDAMGQAAAMTGGLGNSYAQSVGQQTYQGYLQQLNDKIPELYSLALDKYNMDRQELKDQYGILNDDKAFEYGLHRDAVDDFNTERAFLTDEYWRQSNDAWDKYVTGEEQRLNEYGIERDALIDARDYLYKTEQDKIANDIALEQLALQKKNLTSSSSGGSGRGSGNGGSGSGTSGNGSSSGNDAPVYEKTPAVNSFIGRIRTRREFARGNNSDKTAYGSYENYVLGMLEKYEKELTDNDIATIAQIYGLQLN